MWRGGKAKSGYPRKRTDLALGVRLSFLSFVSLQVSVVKLQCLYNKIRFLSFWDRFGNEFGYPFITKSRLFPLIWFFFLHNALDNLVCELAVLHKLLHFDSLCKRWGSVIVAHSFKQSILLFLRSDMRFQRQGRKATCLSSTICRFQETAQLDG